MNSTEWGNPEVVGSSPTRDESFGLQKCSFLSNRQTSEVIFQCLLLVESFFSFLHA